MASLAHQPPVPQDNLPKLDTNVNTQIRNIIGGLRIAHSLYLRLHVILDKSVHRHVFLEQLVRLVVRWTDGVVGVRRALAASLLLNVVVRALTLRSINLPPPLSDQHDDRTSSALSYIEFLNALQGKVA